MLNDKFSIYPFISLSVFVGATPHHGLCNRSTQLGNLKPERLMFVWLKVQLTPIFFFPKIHSLVPLIIIAKHYHD
mgnify:CR=1 FL=1